jgi:tetratricopeptide (TPR) repeat protein
MRARSLCGVCLVATLWLGCAPTLPRPYVEAKAAGHRAYGAGRYDEAATYFRSAAEKAERIKDRDEVLYLEAASFQRAGRNREAKVAYEALVVLSPSGERAARAAYETVQLELSEGDEAKGWKMMHDFVLSYPKSGLARRALLRYLVHLDEEQGAEATVAYLEKGNAWYEAHELGEAALYQKAIRLERLDRLEEARDTFVACANKYPYPDGGLFDDSLFRASLLDEKLGQPRKAVEHLRKMLYVREPSTFQGSYERPRFSEAQMRIGVLYRDALGEPDAARREFRKLYDSFTTSILRDDALWAEAQVASKQGDRAGSCDAVTLLVKKLPDSRYAPCAKLLCDDAPEVDPPRECRPYVERELEADR